MNFKVIENQIVDMDSGEIISKKDIIKAQEEHIKNEFDALMQDSYILRENVEIKIVKVKGIKYSCNNVKDNYVFNKQFRGDLKLLYDNVKLSIHAHAFISLFSAYINFPYNNIVINGENITHEKMCEMLGVKKSKMFEILNELEKYYIIKRVKCGKDKVVYFNPFLYSGGAVVHNDTYEMFKFNPYNPQMFADSQPEKD